MKKTNVFMLKGKQQGENRKIEAVSVLCRTGQEVRGGRWDGEERGRDILGKVTYSKIQVKNNTIVEL